MTLTPEEILAREAAAAFAARRPEKAQRRIGQAARVDRVARKRGEGVVWRRGES